MKENFQTSSNLDAKKMKEIRYFIFSESEDKKITYEVSLLEFSLRSMVPFGYYSSKLAIVLPFEHLQKILVLGGRSNDFSLKNVDYWTPFFLTKKRYETLIDELLQPNLKSIFQGEDDICIPDYIIHDIELNSGFSNIKQWLKMMGKKYIPSNELRQFSIELRYNLFFNGNLVGNFVCVEARRNSIFKGKVEFNSRITQKKLQNSLIIDDKSLVPLELEQWRIEDNYSILRELKFARFTTSGFLHKLGLNISKKYNVFLQTIYP